LREALREARLSLENQHLRDEIGYSKVQISALNEKIDILTKENVRLIQEQKNRYDLEQEQQKREAEQAQKLAANFEQKRKTLEEDFKLRQKEMQTLNEQQLRKLIERVHQEHQKRNEENAQHTLQLNQIRERAQEDLRVKTKLLQEAKQALLENKQNETATRNQFHQENQKLKMELERNRYELTKAVKKESNFEAKGKVFFISNLGFARKYSTKTKK